MSVEVQQFHVIREDTLNEEFRKPNLLPSCSVSTAVIMRFADVKLTQYLN